MKRPEGDERIRGTIAARDGGRRRTARRRRGLTLLEITIASSMLAMIVTSVMVVLRTGREAWDAHEADFTRLQAAHATVRHIVREIRQADGVSAITSSTQSSGSLTLTMGDGRTLVWRHLSGGERVMYGVASADHLLAPNIAELRFAGFRADGTTPATVPADVQCIRVTATVRLPRGANSVRTVGSWAWVRSW